MFVRLLHVISIRGRTMVDGPESRIESRRSAASTDGSFPLPDPSRRSARPRRDPCGDRLVICRLFGTPRPRKPQRLRPDQVSDFLQFYTLGDIGRAGPSADLYDDARRHARQVQLVRRRRTARCYLGVYGPQPQSCRAPEPPSVCRRRSRLGRSKRRSLCLVRDAGVASLARRASRHPVRSAAALAFPPAWQLAAYGQTTAIPLLAFTIGWLALEDRRPFTAGLALGLLAVKPQLGLVLAAVAIVTAQWPLIAGVAASLIVQGFLVAARFGPSTIFDYARALRRIPETYRLLEAATYKMHSLSTLTELLPRDLAVTSWALGSVFIVAAVVLTWRSIADRRVRFGVLVLASVLVSPHVGIDDQRCSRCRRCGCILPPPPPPPISRVPVKFRFRWC